MKKSTTARIEDTLDIVAEKIIDLENTAKQLEQLKRSISSEISRFENLSLKIDTTTVKEENKQFLDKITTLNKKHLQEIDKKNKIHRPLYYFIIFLLVSLFISFACLVHLNNKNSELKYKIERTSKI